MIEGYESGKVVPAGQRLRMTCTVSGGKPLVTSVDFSCPGHPDVEPDDVTKRAVISTLTIGAWRLRMMEYYDALSNSTVVIVAAASAGGVIVIAIVVVFIIWRRRGV
nr:hypothetical protein BaRGS_009951 [Batillaria attramentaria]